MDKCDICEKHSDRQQKGNPQAREDRIVCSEKNYVVHQTWQETPILQGLTYLTLLYIR